MSENGNIDLDALERLSALVPRGEWKVASDLPAYSIYDAHDGYRIVQTPNQNNWKKFGPSENWLGIPEITKAQLICAAVNALPGLIEIARSLQKIDAKDE